MAAAAAMSRPSPKPEVAIIINSKVAIQEDAVGVEIPLLNVNLTEIKAASESTIKAMLPSGQVALAFTISFRTIGDRVTAVANLSAADQVKTIHINQESRDYVDIAIEHRHAGQYADTNCKLQCSQGRAISASGHCIDCAGPLGRVRLCC